MTSNRSCPFCDDLKAFADGELSPLHSWRVRRHLRGCAGCRAELAVLQSLSQIMKTEAQIEGGELSPQLRAQILDAAQSTAPNTPATAQKTRDMKAPSKRPAPRFSFNPLALAGVAGILLAVALNVNFGGSSSESATMEMEDAAMPATDASSSAAAPSSAQIPGQRFKSRRSRDDFPVAAGAALAPPAASMAPEMSQRAPEAPLGATRRVHKSGNLIVGVSDVERASEAVESAIKKSGGFVANTQLSTLDAPNEQNGVARRVATLDTRVPVDKFEEVVGVVSRLGTVRAKNIAGEDITARFEGEKAQRDSLNQSLAIQEARLRELVAREKKSEAAQQFQLRQQIIALRAQTADARARFEATRRLAALSTLSISLEERTDDAATGSFGAELNQTARDAWVSFVEAAKWPLQALIYIVVYAPFWLPALLLWRRYGRQMTS